MRAQLWLDVEMHLGDQQAEPQRTCASSVHTSTFAVRIAASLSPFSRLEHVLWCLSVDTISAPCTTVAGAWSIRPFVDASMQIQPPGV